MKIDHQIRDLSLLGCLTNSANKSTKKRLIKAAIAYGQYLSVALLKPFYKDVMMAAWYQVAVEQAIAWSKNHGLDMPSQNFIDQANSLAKDVDAHDLKCAVEVCRSEIEHLV